MLHQRIKGSNSTTCERKLTQGIIDFKIILSEVYLITSLWGKSSKWLGNKIIAMHVKQKKVWRIMNESAIKIVIYFNVNS